MPASNSFHFNDFYLLIEQMGDGGIHIPENQKKRGILDIPPTGLLDQVPESQPVDKYGQTDGKISMGEYAARRVLLWK